MPAAMHGVEVYRPRPLNHALGRSLHQVAPLFQIVAHRRARTQITQSVSIGSVRPGARAILLPMLALVGSAWTMWHSNEGDGARAFNATLRG